MSQINEDEKVSEQGDPAQLLARNGLYARFQHLQRLGAVRDEVLACISSARNLWRFFKNP